LESHIYEDFDAFTENVSGIDAVMMLQNPRHRIWSVSRIDLPGAQVQVGRLGSGNIVEGQSFSDGYLLSLPLTENCAYSANGATIEPGSLMILEPGCEFCVATKNEHDWCSLFLPTDTLADRGSYSGSSTAVGKSTCRVSPANLHLANQMRSLVRDVSASAGAGSRFEATPAAQDAVQRARRIASAIIGERGTEDELLKGGRPKLPRQELIRRCRGLLEERRGKRISIGEFAAAAGVTERTLRSAFYEYFGTGPVHYLQLRQLHQVHRALRAADPYAESVTDVLFRHGVWELSRFARRYRETFGELPSQTLDKSRWSSFSGRVLDAFG